MMQEENLQMELETIVIIQEDHVPILIGRDPIGIDLKNLLELKSLGQLFHISTVEHM